MPDYAAMRQTMVDTQLRTCNIGNAALLHAFSTVPREIFVAEKDRPMAYSDDCLKLGDKQFMLPPSLLGQLIQALNTKTHHKILTIGCNTGYTATILGYLAKQVVALEDNPASAKITETNLAHCRSCNVDVVVGSLPAGWPQEAPYDCILIHGTIPDVPADIFEQLADQGGLVAILQHGQNNLGRATLFQRKGENISKQRLFNVTCPALQEFSPQPKFHFN